MTPHLRTFITVTFVITFVVVLVVLGVHYSREQKPAPSPRVVEGIDIATPAREPVRTPAAVMQQEPAPVAQQSVPEAPRVSQVIGAATTSKCVKYVAFGPVPSSTITLVVVSDGLARTPRDIRKYGKQWFMTLDASCSRSERTLSVRYIGSKECKCCSGEPGDTCVETFKCECWIYATDKGGSAEVQ